MSKLAFRRVLVFVIAAALSTALFRADVVVLEPVKDNTLIEEPAGSLSNGAGPHFRAGRTSQGVGSIRRGLLSFAPASAIPPGSLVTNIFLTLHLSQTNGGPAVVSLHRVLTDWGEATSTTGGGAGAPAMPGDATWLHTFYDSYFWSRPGGEFDSTPSAGIVVDQPGFYTWGSTPRLLEDVQLWLDFPGSAHGWLLLGDESAPTTAKRFDSRENGEPSLRPNLTVEFIPPIVDDEDEDEDEDEDDEEGDRRRGVRP
jgi:hypothetical protein